MKQMILAIDDEPDMIRLLERIITQKTNYGIVITNNVLEVPQLLEKQTFDLVLTDLNMPGMTGLDVVGYIKENKRFEEVILLTAFDSVEASEEALELGAFDYIAKPFRRTQLLFAVERAMRWQIIKKQAKYADSILDLEPYKISREAYNREYIKRLSKRCNSDINDMAIRSELTREFIEKYKNSHKIDM